MRNTLELGKEDRGEQRSKTQSDESSNLNLVKMRITIRLAPSGSYTQRMN